LKIIIAEEIQRLQRLSVAMLYANVRNVNGSAQRTNNLVWQRKGAQAGDEEVQHGPKHCRDDGGHGNAGCTAFHMSTLTPRLMASGEDTSTPEMKREINILYAPAASDTKSSEICAGGSSEFLLGLKHPRPAGLKCLRDSGTMLVLVPVLED